MCHSPWIHRILRLSCTVSRLSGRSAAIAERDRVVWSGDQRLRSGLSELPTAWRVEFACPSMKHRTAPSAFSRRASSKKPTPPRRWQSITQPFSACATARKNCGGYASRARRGSRHAPLRCTAIQISPKTRRRMEKAATASPMSWPGIAVRRTACFRTPMTRPSMRLRRNFNRKGVRVAFHHGCAGQARA
jgi:hypothetical protein